MNLIHHAWQDRELERMARVAYDLRARGYTPPPIVNNLTSGTTFTPLVTGLYRIECLGGGGGGGAGSSSASASTLFGLGGAGGAPGGSTQAYMTLTGGTAYTYALGTAGTGGTVTSGATHNGGNGSVGGNTTFTGPSTLVAPGGGGAQGASFETPVTVAVINGDILTVTLTNGFAGAQGTPGTSLVGIRSAAGGTWGSAGSSGAGINGLWPTSRNTGGTPSSYDLVYGNGSIVPSGTYTASSGLAAPFAINGGIPGENSYSILGNIWGAGYGGPGVWLPSIPLYAVQAGGAAFGLGGGGGGCGGASATSTSYGGTGASAGTLGGGGANGSNGGNTGSANGTAGASASANTGAGGGGGGGAAAGNAGAGGAGGTGLIVITGPFPASGI